MTDLFARRRDIASCAWNKLSHLGKCSNGKSTLRTSTLVIDGTLRSTAHFASALINVNNVKISDLLEFLVTLLFSSLCSHPKIIYRKQVQDYENIHGGNSFLITFNNLWKRFISIFTCNFAKTYRNGYFPMKLPLVTCKKE